MTYGLKAEYLVTSLPVNLNGYHGHYTLLTIISIGLHLNSTVYINRDINKGIYPSILFVILAAHIQF